MFISAVAAGKNIVVDASGKGDFKTIQGAINSLPDSAATPRTIFIKNGIYNEKLYIQKSNIIFSGEDREKTVITQAIARDEWRCLHNDDWGVATINLEANDVTLQNLSITNSYGRDAEERTIQCLKDSINPIKKIGKGGHQMALRTFKCTRLKVINCKLVAYGGDTVSPWYTSGGMFYFKDCVMEGGVDFYCPRGWAYAENCTFIANGGTAAIWHDGSAIEDSKTVLKGCTFTGFDHFKLGRYHRDAQFYLLDCRFAQNMANEDIYLVKTDNQLLWGRRVYYFNCHRIGGNDFSWHANNLNTAKGDPEPATINARWVFKNNWNPELN